MVSADFAITGPGVAAAACYPPLIFFSVVGLSETLFITLILAAFLFWYRGRFTVAAIFAVLAVLTRPVFDIFAPALVLLFALLVSTGTQCRQRDNSACLPVSGRHALAWE